MGPLNCHDLKMIQLGFLILVTMYLYIYIYMSMISDKSTLNISLQKGSTVGASLGLGLSFAHLQSFVFDSMLSLPFKQAQVVKINPVLFVQRWTTENPS